MADIRIKDLTTTASSTASDDFFAADGTTNGTRKLSAYSPSFGGNATVGGTLTTAGNPTFGTSGNTTLTLGTTGAAYTHYIRSATAGGAIQIKGDPTTGSRWLSLGRNDNLGAYVESININSNGLVSTSGDNETHISFVRNGTVSIGPDAAATPSLVVSTTLKISGTTASTSTSSGALVVGNGTSGGLGVGGAIYAGGYLSTGNHARIGAQSSVVALSANNNVDGGLPAAWTGNYGVGVQYLGSSSNAFFIGDGSGGSTHFYTRTGSANTARLSIDNTNGNVTIGGTLQVGNAYVAGAPTATGYIVIKDSTGTSYKIPAVAL